ncbi:MAG: undecaprenyldiphospho-muramoylpentapeptide beta-N-acetylglucosaminyltransferase [Alphaproteobacteria bacterium]|nr:undecaprenyldiphospho-muramoylpentapeptide beta-N-acetylglucosaminyltransferase [Alphaproteobacteria bacterium]
MTSNTPHIVLAAGGTGGHVFPAEALATTLLGRGCKLTLITDRRGGNWGENLGNVNVIRIRASAVAGKGILGKVMSVFRLGIGTLQARGHLKKIKPACVVGFGGYASVPTMFAATMSGVSTALHEQNALLGRANKLLAPRVNKVATSFENAKEVEAVAPGKVVYTGMPVRSQVAEVRGANYPELTKKSEIHLLVIGGSQGAKVFSEIVPQALALLPKELQKRIHIAQQCRSEDLTTAEKAYEGLEVKTTLKTFFDDIPQRLAGTHLVIARAGASTIAELTAVGRPALLVPYPYAADDHQTFNAHAIDEAGGGWLIPQDSFTPENLAQRLESLFSLPRTLQNAASGALSAGRPDAAEKLADMVFKLLPVNGNNKDGRKAA